MRLFKRRAHTAPAPAEAATSSVDPAVELKAEQLQEAAEEKQEYDDEVEVSRARRGLNPRWGLSRGDDEVARREARAVADRESDGAEERFIRSEREAEERRRYGLRD